jgi:hypothetical protein
MKKETIKDIILGTLEFFFGSASGLIFLIVIIGLIRELINKV